MSELLDALSRDLETESKVFAKFISANDAGTTESHQRGIYLPSTAWSFLFDREGKKEENLERPILIRWQGEDAFVTESRVKWYGCGTRSEYRVTCFGRGFPLLKPDTQGALLVLIREDEIHYLGYVIQDGDEIDATLALLGISASETNRIVRGDGYEASGLEERDILAFVHKTLTETPGEFPSTAAISSKAQSILELHYGQNRRMSSDARLIRLRAIEFGIFRKLEDSMYGERLSRPFENVDDLVSFGNTVLQRRKSRSGKSLEHHLSYLMTRGNITFESQGIIEGVRKPDFIFPSVDAYCNPDYPEDGLVFLAAKTTLKERWSEILREAGRIPHVFLATLQYPVSNSQLREMTAHGIRLVVPSRYHASFPRESRSGLFSLGSFMDFVRRKTDPQ